MPSSITTIVSVSLLALGVLTLAAVIVLWCARRQAHASQGGMAELHDGESEAECSSSGNEVPEMSPSAPKGPVVGLSIALVSVSRHGEALIEALQAAGLPAVLRHPAQIPSDELARPIIVVLDASREGTGRGKEAFPGGLYELIIPGEAENVLTLWLFGRANYIPSLIVPDDNAEPVNYASLLVGRVWEDHLRWSADEHGNLDPVAAARVISARAREMLLGSWATYDLAEQFAHWQAQTTELFWLPCGQSLAIQDDDEAWAAAIRRAAAMTASLCRSLMS